MAESTFQKAVWSRVRGVPPGKVTTYGNIAAALGRPVNAGLAVGQALQKAPPDVPWWRVVQANGGLIRDNELRPIQIMILEKEGIRLAVPEKLIL